MTGRRLTPLGARLAYLGFTIAVLAGLLGNRPLLLCGVALGLLPLVSALALRRPEGRTSLLLPRRLQAGAAANIRVQFTLPVGRPSAPVVLAVVADEWQTPRATVGSLASGATVQTTFGVVPVKRGIIRRVGVQIEARDPLGLARVSYLTSPADQTRIVHPAVVGCPPLPVTRAEPIPEFAGLRGWQPGDQPRDVDWRATARRPGSAPVVRLWDETAIRGGRFTIGLVGTADPDVNERIAELAAAAVRQALVGHDAITLRWVDGELTAQRLEPLLDTLAEQPLPVEGPGALPPGCDLLIGPVYARLGGAPHLWRVDGQGHVAAG